MLICKFCCKECKNENSHRNNERLCPKNADRIYTPGMLGKTSHKKGLTKETDESLARQGETLKTNYDNGKIKRPTGGVWTEEMRKAKSEWRKQYHKDNPDAHPNRRLAGNRKCMSYPERVAFDFLTRSNVDFLHNTRVLKYYPDFIVGKTIIEIDGARWHDKEKDKIRDEALVKGGYVVHRIDSKEQIETRISEILGLG